MSLARVHAVMAAGVENPRLLEQWREQPALLRAHGVDPDAFDLDALGKFAGLSVKVRHNPLRPLLQTSFRLMSVAAIEIALFSAYAAHRSRQELGYANTVSARSRDLIEFIGAWIDPDDRVQRLLWDIVRYEDALARLGPWRAQAAEANAVADTADAPRIRGEIVLLETQCDPQALIAALRANAPDLNAVAPTPRLLCLWRAPGSDEVSTLALDEFGFYLLGQIDGRRAPATLARRLGGGRGMRAAVDEALRTFADLGLVSLPVAH